MTTVAGAQIVELTKITKGDLARQEVPSFPEAARQMEAYINTRLAERKGSPEVVLVAHNCRKYAHINSRRFSVYSVGVVETGELIYKRQGERVG